MWEELQQRAKTTSVDENLAGQMTYAVVKESTSTAVGSDTEGSVFDTTIEGFSRLQNRALDFLMQAPKYSFPQIFRQYLSTPQWTTVGDEVLSSHALAITPELDLPLQVCLSALFIVIVSSPFEMYELIADSRVETARRTGICAKGTGICAMSENLANNV